MFAEAFIVDSTVCEISISRYSVTILVNSLRTDKSTDYTINVHHYTIAAIVVNAHACTMYLVEVG